MSKAAIKFYVVPGVIALVIIIILLLIPINNKKNVENISPTPMAITSTPDKAITVTQDNNISPTLIPPQSFTGADINQEIPQDIKEIGIQKTALRRLTPLTLPFGTIEFDYENDIFLVQLSQQNEQGTRLFTTWREQNYPALPQDRFAFR